MSDETLPDPDSEPYWQGAAAGELRYQRCGHCDAAIFYPRALCTNARSSGAIRHAAKV